MQVYEHTRTSAHFVVDIASADRQKRRKQRLTSVLKEGLPTLPDYVFKLNTLLSAESVDLKRVGRVIRNDPSLSAQVLRMCNSALFSLRRRVLSIEEAAILMGAERLRTLVLTCSVMEFTGRHMSREDFQVLLVPQLHDRGIERSCLAMAGIFRARASLSWRAAARYRGVAAVRGGRRRGCAEGTDEERTVGRVAGSRKSILWNESLRGGCAGWASRGISFPSFIDVFEHHHNPERSARDPHLVGIIAAADHFCEYQSLNAAIDAEPTELAETDPSFEEEFLSRCFPRLEAKERSELTEMLETEYLHLLPMIEFNNMADQPVAERKV